jgi:teichoic acid transport system permease protein
VTSEPGQYSDIEYVFEPHSPAVPDLRQYGTALLERRQFMMELARADLRSLRTSTALGNIWSVLDPLFQAAIYFFLFNVLRKGQGTAGFLPVLLGGFFLFQLSLQALGEGGSSIKRARGLLLASTFPRALLPITSVYKSLKNFVPSIFVFAVLFPLVGGKLGTGLFLLPLLFAIQLVMNIGIALLVSTFVTLVPDAQNVMNYITRVLFFATPVVYPATLLAGSAKLLTVWQPLFPVFASYQAIFTGGVPSPGYMIEAAAWAVFLLVVGTRVFLRHEREFAMHL